MSTNYQDNVRNKVVKDSRHIKKKNLNVDSFKAIGKVKNSDLLNKSKDYNQNSTTMEE